MLKCFSFWGTSVFKSPYFRPRAQIYHIQHWSTPSFSKFTSRIQNLSERWAESCGGFLRNFGKDSIWYTQSQESIRFWDGSSPLWFLYTSRQSRNYWWHPSDIGVVLGLVELPACENCYDLQTTLDARIFLKLSMPTLQSIIMHHISFNDYNTCVQRWTLRWTRVEDVIRPSYFVAALTKFFPRSYKRRSTINRAVV